MGYELVDAYANRNYSMSYMFSYGPFFHTGVKADVTKGKSGFMLGVANPTDIKSSSFTRKFVIAQYSLALDKFKAYVNYQGGKPADDARMRQFDVVLTNTFSDKFSLGYNGTVATSKTKENGKFGDGSEWWGSALYANVDPVSWLGLTLRSEYFNDKKNVSAASFDGAGVFANTLSLNFRINNLILIPELRLDNADKEIFVKHDNTPVKNTASFLMAVVYKL